MIESARYQLIESAHAAHVRLRRALLHQIPRIPWFLFLSRLAYKVREDTAVGRGEARSWGHKLLFGSNNIPTIPIRAGQSYDTWYNHIIAGQGRSPTEPYTSVSPRIRTELTGKGSLICHSSLFIRRSQNCWIKMRSIEDFQIKFNFLICFCKIQKFHYFSKFYETDAPAMN